MVDKHFIIKARQKKTGGWIQRIDRQCFLCLMITILLPSAAWGDGVPLQMEADRIDSVGGMTRASGDVQAHFRGYKLCAGRLEYDRDTGLLRAVHEVRLMRDHIQIQGERADYNVQGQRGEVEQFSAHLADSGLIAQGSRVTLHAGGMTAYDVGISSCPLESQDWRLHARQVEAVDDAQQIIVRDTTLEVVGIPLLYIPYGRFYYGKEKRSGFLQPELHLGSGSGLGFTSPYYLALADHYDLTITPNYRSNHGLELGGDFRFLTRNSEGDLHVAAAFFDDEGRGREQLNYRLHNGDWQLMLAAENVSDNHYLRDYIGGDSKSTRTLPRLARLAYSGDGVQMQAVVEDFQSLDDSLTAPYQALPQIEVATYGGGDVYDWRSSWQYSYFRHDTLSDDGSRGVWRGKARYYHRLGDFLLSPAVGGQAVKYNGGGGKQAFFVPYARLDIENHHYDVLVGEGSSYDHLRLHAGLVWAREDTKQSGAPLYDTALRELTADNLSEENRFVGSDRAPDSRFIVYGGNYYLFDRENKEKRFVIGAAQRYYMRPTKVRAQANEIPLPQGFGDILVNSRFFFGRGWRFALAAEWDGRQDSIREFYSEVHGRFGDGNLLHLRYHADEDESLVIGASATPGDWLEIAAQTDYLMDEDRFTRSRIAGRLRDSCNCWRISFTITDTVAAEGDNDTEYSFGVELVGLGNLGNDYESLLNDLRP